MSKHSVNKKSKTEKPTSAAKPRKLKDPKYNSFHLQKSHTKPKAAKILSSFKLFRHALGLIKRNWLLFLGITAVYTVLNLLLVQGFFNIDLTSVREQAQALAAGNWGTIIGGFSGLSYLFGNSGADPTTGAYRVILMLLVSLAIIWVLRQLVINEPGKRIRLRDAFYASMYPLVPFVLVFLLICLQLVPLTLAMYLVGAIGITNGIELLLWVIILVTLTAVTLYMLSSSIFALYIACLPGMQPVEALRTAVQLVRHRRLFVLRRVLFLPLALFVGLSILVVPFIVFYTPAAIALFFIFLMTVLPIVHSYMYLLYRELLNAQ
jgi:hypothetical protein